MKNYYCIIALGNTKNVTQILETVINGKFNHFDFDKVFVSTFESDSNIWEIEEILFKHKKSFFLTKMGDDNFTATVQDPSIQNQLFLDYVQKMIASDNEKYSNHINDFEIIDESVPETLFNEDEMEEIKQELKEIKEKYSKKEKVLSLDELLDKINLVGYDKLSPFEKDTLKKYSEK